jgi:TolA-binding protein
LLKQAYSFIALGDRKTGTIILEKLIEKYPDSKEAELARKKL